MTRLRHHYSQVTLAFALLSFCNLSLAEIQTRTNNNGNPLTAQARLNFELNIGKFMFFRVGAGSAYTGAASGTGPTASASVSTVTLNVTPSIPATPTTPANGTNSVSWNGAAPSFLTSAPVSVPVEIRSNAGQVKITGELTTPLTSGSNSIAMTDLVFTSNVAVLPAPQIPNTGASAATFATLGGAGTAAAPTLLTYQTANWSYQYNSTTPPPAGAYSGVITYTASAP